MGVLYDIYSEGVYPAEEISKHCARNKMYKDEISRSRKELEQFLPDSAIPRLEDYVDTLNQRMSVELYLSFKYGFCLGVNLCKESLDTDL